MFRIIGKLLVRSDYRISDALFRNFLGKFSSKKEACMFRVRYSCILQARNQGGSSEPPFLRTPFQKYEPPPTNFPTAYLTSNSKHVHHRCIYSDSAYMTDLLGPLLIGLRTPPPFNSQSEQPGPIAWTSPKIVHKLLLENRLEHWRNFAAANIVQLTRI